MNPIVDQLNEMLDDPSQWKVEDEKLIHTNGTKIWVSSLCFCIQKPIDVDLPRNGDLWRKAKQLLDDLNIAKFTGVAPKRTVRTNEEIAVQVKVEQTQTLRRPPHPVIELPVDRELVDVNGNGIPDYRDWVLDD